MKKHKLTLTADMPITSNDGFYDPCVNIIPLSIFADSHERHWQQLNKESLEATRYNGGLSIEDACELFSFSELELDMTYQDIHTWVHEYVQMCVGEGSVNNTTNQSIPIRLPCPDCGVLHIDTDMKPHHTHACQNCGNIWRPATVNTVGVQFLPGFKNDGT